ncbi:PREDICTED: zinc finger protein 93-like [Priapulus caudatus]|uniref:Zinc finger protein 93-like n=1 Tax=Priapulus caudatus TaxID=37621 RepID=A0ABM1EAE8_PRICU|nr:PREDICTED: zinc finger protein 93-like [Priapulus caudatus]
MATAIEPLGKVMAMPVKLEEQHEIVTKYESEDEAQLLIAKNEEEIATRYGEVAEESEYENLNGVTSLFTIQLDHSYCTTHLAPKAIKHPKLRSCNICGISFMETNYRQSLAKHLIDCHAEEGKGQCDICGHRCENSKNNYSAAIIKHREKHFANQGQTQSRNSTGPGKRAKRLSKTVDAKQSSGPTTIDGVTVSESDVVGEEFVDGGEPAEAKKTRKEKPVMGTCKNCGKGFKSEAWLQQHLRKRICYATKLKVEEETSEEESLKCEQCKKDFVSEAALKLHRRRDHRAGDRFECPTCLATFPTSASVQRHKKSCVRPPAKGRKPKAKTTKAAAAAVKVEASANTCETCSRPFPTSHGMSRHQALMRHGKYAKKALATAAAAPKLNRNYKMFACDTCPREFLSRRGLSHHRISEHPKDRLACDSCDATFLMPGRLEGHRNKFHAAATAPASSSSSRCDVCKKTFPKPADLARHAEDVHVTCGVCKQAFATMRQLTKHGSAAHKEKDLGVPETRKRFATPAAGPAMKPLPRKPAAPQPDKSPVVAARTSTRAKVIPAKARAVSTRAGRSRARK